MEKKESSLRKLWPRAGENYRSHKKSRKTDINRHRRLYFQLGLVISLALVIMAFEWRFYVPPPKVMLPEQDSEDFLVLMEAIREHRIKSPPPARKREILEKPPRPDSKIIEWNDAIPLPDLPPHPTQVNDPIPVITIPYENANNTVVDWTGNMPEPSGGWEAFYKFVQKNLRYPRPAIQQQVEGKVFIQFIVEKDGSLSNVHVIKGIGYGCDAEAKRVISQHPPFRPGQQGLRRVRVRMVLPITFRLQ